MLETIQAALTKVSDSKLIARLLEAYIETKRNYYLGNLRPSEVEGGRFCEAAFRMLQQRTTKKFTSLGQQLNTEKVILDLGNIPANSQPESIRLNIPRALRVVYDIRNKRDAAHLADGIDPNLQDATLVVSVLDWVLAEFVRLDCAASPNEAQRIIEGLVTRRVPAIQNFKGFLKVLNPSLSASNCLLLLLYARGAEGATHDELKNWVRPKMKANLQRTLSSLVNNQAYIHFDGVRYLITEAGIREVERKKLYQVP